MLEWGEKFYDWYGEKAYDYGVYWTLFYTILLWAYFMIEYAILPQRELVPFVGVPTIMLILELMFIEGGMRYDGSRTD